jgi:hypothetical protein
MTEITSADRSSRHSARTSCKARNRVRWPRDGAGRQDIVHVENFHTPRPVLLTNGIHQYLCGRAIPSARIVNIQSRLNTLRDIYRKNVSIAWRCDFILVAATEKNSLAQQKVASNDSCWRNLNRYILPRKREMVRNQKNVMAAGLIFLSAGLMAAAFFTQSLFATGTTLGATNPDSATFWRWFALGSPHEWCVF